MGRVLSLARRYAVGAAAFALIAVIALGASALLSSGNSGQQLALAGAVTTTPTVPVASVSPSSAAVTLTPSLSSDTPTAGGTTASIDIQFAQSSPTVARTAGTVTADTAAGAYPAPATAVTDTVTRTPQPAVASVTATLTPLSTTTTVHSTLVISQTNLNEMSGGVASIWDYEGGLRKATDGELQVLTDTLLLPHMATNLQTIDKPPFALGQFRLIQPTTDVTCAEPRLQMPHIGETPDKLHINLSIQTSNCAFVFTLAGTTNISPTLRPALMMNGGSTHPVSVTLTVLTGSMSSKTVNVPLNTVKQAIPLVPDMAIEVTIPANTFVSLDYADTALFGVEDVTGVPADAETRLFLSDAAPRDEPAQKAWELDQWTYAATGLATYQKQNGQTLDGIPDNGAHLVFSQLAMVGPTNEKYPYGGDSCAWHTMTPRGGGFWFANADSRITNALCGSIAVRGQGRYVITGVSQENLRHWGADGDPRVAFGIAGHMSGRYRITIAQVDLSTSDTKEELVVTKVITSTPWLQLTTGRPQFQADWKGEAFVVIEFDTPFGQIDIGPTAGATSVDVRWPTKPQDAPQASNQLDLVRTSLPPATTNRGPVVATPGGR